MRCELADGLGLTEGLAAAMAPTKRRRRGHDRGRVLTDLAVAIADGATAITDRRVLAEPPDLFGQVASAATVWRALGAIDAALDHGLSQGLIESTNTKIRLLTRIAFGFRSPEALIALAMLALGGHRPALPGRNKHPRISQ